MDLQFFFSVVRRREITDALNIYCSTRLEEFFRDRACTRKHATRVLYCRKKRRTTRAASAYVSARSVEEFLIYLCNRGHEWAWTAHLVTFRRCTGRAHKSLKSISRQSAQFPRRLCARVIIVYRRCCGCRGCRGRMVSRLLHVYTSTHIHFKYSNI